MIRAVSSDSREPSPSPPTRARIAPITETISRQQNGVISCIRSPKRMNRSCGQLPDGVQCGENP